jgi:hypothetical protein
MLRWRKPRGDLLGECASVRKRTLHWLETPFLRQVSEILSDALPDEVDENPERCWIAAVALARARIPAVDVIARKIGKGRRLANS